MTPDSGPVHLAGVTETPALGVYVKNTIEQWGPYWSKRWCVQGTSDRPVTIDQVLERLTALHLAGYPRSGGEGVPIPLPPVRYSNEPLPL